MLALAHAAAHPASIRALVLIGCGTFDTRSRRLLQTIVEGRRGDDLRERIARLETEVADPDQRLQLIGDLLLPLYSYDLAVANEDLGSCDARAHNETWQDMLRLQMSGTYPAAFATIRAPVFMMHGSHDPHPGRSTESTLRPYLPQLEYREWERCGHYPWLERHVSEEFVQVLREWLARTFAATQ